MKSTVSSTISLTTGLAFAILLTFLFTFLLGCGTNDGLTEAEESAADQAMTAQTPRPVSATTPGTTAIDEADTVVAPIGETPRIVTYEEAETAYRDRNYAESLDLFERYVEQKPDNPWGHYMKGLAAWKAASYETAETAFGRALELAPDHVKSMLNLSRVYLDTDRAEEAIIRIDEAIALDPTYAAAHRLRGRALHETGRPLESEEAYREAIRIDERDAWSMNNLGLVLIEQEFFQLAVPPLARATELRQDVAVFYNNLGMALEHSGQYRAAEEAYGMAVELDAAYEKASANLARVETVEQDPTLESVDLNQLARDFEGEIRSWTDEDVPREEPVATGENAGLESAVDENAGAIKESEESEETGVIEQNEDSEAIEIVEQNEGNE